MRNYKNAFRCVLRADERVFRFGIETNGTGELAVVDPLAQYELILVLDTGVDKVTEESSFDSIVRMHRVVGRAVWQATANEPVCVIAATRLTLAGDRLASRVDPADVAPTGTRSPLGSPDPFEFTY